MIYKVIIAALKPDVTDAVVDAAKECGISGATIVPGRGTGVREAKTFLGLTLETQRDVVLLMVEEHMSRHILETIAAAGNFASAAVTALTRVSIPLTPI